MRTMAVIGLGIAMVGCSATEVTRLHNLGEAAVANVSVLTSSCSSECRNAIEQHGEFRSAITAAFGASIDRPTVQAIDGTTGSTDYISNCGGDGNFQVHNSSWNWSFQIEVLPGIRSITAGINNCNIRNRTYHTFRVNLEAGHQYALVSVSRKTKDDVYYDGEAVEWQWYPVVYDETSKRLVLDHSETGWLRP